MTSTLGPLVAILGDSEQHAKIRGATGARKHPVLLARVMLTNAEVGAREMMTVELRDVRPPQTTDEAKELFGALPDGATVAWLTPAGGA